MRVDSGRVEIVPAGEGQSLFFINLQRLGGGADNIGFARTHEGAASFVEGLLGEVESPSDPAHAGDFERGGSVYEALLRHGMLEAQASPSLQGEAESTQTPPPEVEVDLSGLRL